MIRRLKDRISQLKVLLDHPASLALVVMIAFFILWSASLILIPSLNLAIQVTGVTMDVILTTALIFIYTDIAKAEKGQTDSLEEQKELEEDVLEIQENQSDIQARQTELMEVSYRPEISVEGWTVKGDTFIFQLANVGNGLAKEIELKLQFKFREDADWDDADSIKECKGRLNQVEDEEIPPSVLPADMSLREFKSTPQIFADDKAGGGKFVSLTEFIDQVKDTWDAYDWEYRVVLQYRYLKSSLVTREVWGGYVTTDEISHPYEMIRNTYAIIQKGEHIPPKIKDED